jgi:nucleoside 2-deoxyribosyltransferase
MSKVYLAGPITSLNYKGATDWRFYAKSELAKVGILGLSPMRGKEYLDKVPEFTADGDAYKHMGVLSSNRGIITRDRWDATRCDVLLVNLLGAPKVSIGTVMEIAWADSKRIPIVCCMEETGNVHEHGMIAETLGYRVPSLDEAIHVIKAVLG